MKKDIKLGGVKVDARTRQILDESVGECEKKRKHMDDEVLEVLESECPVKTKQTVLVCIILWRKSCKKEEDSNKIRNSVRKNSNCEYNREQLES